MRWLTVLSGLLSAAAVAEARRSLQHVGRKAPVARQPKPERRSQDFPVLEARKANSTESKFLTSSTADYAVNGTGIPDVDFDAGESYAGLLSITDDPDAEDQLFFWFWPTENEAADKEILIWLNGGPGCSSFEGVIQENGPFIWQYGTFAPVPNPWSWNRLTNVVYVEQPVGTGFSVGTPTATSEEEVAAQFLGFWKNFIDLFAMQGYRVYITGESYAGMYVPYIASAMLDAAEANATEAAYYNVSGMLINDPVIGDQIVATSTPQVPFVDYHRNLMPFNASYMATLHGLHQSCGFAAYMDKYLQFPPPGAQPADYDASLSFECLDLQNLVYDEIFSVNPCFDIYQVATTCPLLWDVLGFPGSLSYTPKGADIYFARPDVQAAIHAPANVSWAECADGVLLEDTSDYSAWSKIPHVIEKTANVFINHGVLDMVLLANGTLLNIQNMTWGGALGFQTKPTGAFYVPYHDYSTADGIDAIDDDAHAWQLATLAGAGVVGRAHTERGLTFSTVDLSGHMIPQYAPSAAFRQLEVLLGRVDALNSTAPFTVASLGQGGQVAADAVGSEGTGLWGVN